MKSFFAAPFEGKKFGMIGRADRLITGLEPLRVALILLIALAMSWCWGCQKAQETPEDRGDDVREAVYKYMFDKYMPELQADVEIYYLAVGSRSDPRSDLVERFKGHVPPVRKVSASSRLGTGGVHDRSTGQKGVVFNIGSLKWIGEKEAIATGGLYQGGESVASSTFHVEWLDGEWVITEEDMDYGE